MKLDLSRLLKSYMMARTGGMRGSNFRVKARSAAGLIAARVLISGAITIGSPLLVFWIVLPSKVASLFSTLFGYVPGCFSFSVTILPSGLSKIKQIFADYESTLGGLSKAKKALKRDVGIPHVKYTLKDLRCSGCIAISLEAFAISHYRIHMRLGYSWSQ